MEFKGTKGEWKVDYCDREGSYNVYSLDGEFICTTFNDLDTEKYNALLTSKAPKMLEAMNEFCERVEKGEIKSFRTYNTFKQIIKDATEFK